MPTFYVDFTGEDRIKIEPKIKNGNFKGIKLIYQTAKKTERVNYSVSGFDPFFEWDWLTVVRYDNLKGNVLKDLMKPTPVTFSPHGLHVKENWGQMSMPEMINKILKDIKNWEEFRFKYDDKLHPISEEKRLIANRNYPRVENLIKYLLSFDKPECFEVYNSIYNEQILIPVPQPQEDDWILEQNSISAHRSERMAIKGKPDFVKFGPFEVLTYQKPDEL